MAAIVTPQTEIIHPNTNFVREALDWLQTEQNLFNVLDFYEDFTKDPNCDNWTIAQIAAGDRYYLLTHVLRRPDAIHPWLYERCREVEAEPDECLDLWARFHYKSTIITFAGSIQEIIKDPDITIAIFSHSKGIARGFLEHIKTEMEQNEDLPRLWPDIFWDDPTKQSSRWSLDRGIVVKRKANPKEGTVEAWGLVDGQPTSRHFKLRIYDDTVSEESVGTSEQIEKTTLRWELSQNLGDGKYNRRWHIGTRYNFGDSYQTLITRKVLKLRIYPATDDGTITGTPVFMDPDAWLKKLNDESTYTIACQMLQNPVAGSEQTFQPEWVRHWEVRQKYLNIYILVDYAGSRKNTGSANTAMAVIGVDHGRNKILVDGVCHKLSLSDRWNYLKYFHKKWVNMPGVQMVKVGYERYGAQSDIEHFEEMMKLQGYSFNIEEVNWPREGSHSKDERIKRLQPDHQNWRFFYPDTFRLVKEGNGISFVNVVEHGQRVYTKLQLKAIQAGEEYLVAKPIKHKDENGKIYDLMEKFMKNEYFFFPNTTYKDFFDAMSRIYDMDPSPPQIVTDADTLPPVPED